MELSKIKNKKGAIELSIGTVVIIVLAMSMLILGLVLIRKIFTGATESVDTLNEKVKGEIANLFTEEGSKVAIRLGADKTATVKQGNRLGVAIGASAEQTIANQNQLQFKLKLLDNSDTGCRQRFQQYYFKDYRFTNFETPPTLFEDYEGLKGYSIIIFDIPKDAPDCEQRVQIIVKDTTQAGLPDATATFRVRIITGGIFS